MSGVGSFVYNLLLTVHIIAVVAAFGPPLVITRVLKLAREQGGDAGAKTASLASFAFNKVSLPAAIGAVVAGVLLVVVSDGAWSFSQPWISAAFTVILLLVLIGFFVVAPAIAKTIVARPQARRSRQRKGQLGHGHRLLSLRPLDHRCPDDLEARRLISELACCSP